MLFPKQKYRSTKSLIHSLDRVFSEFIRLRDADNQGYCKCISCGEVGFWKEMDAGHFVSRDRKSTRYDPRNVHAQCLRCNRFRSGEQYIHGRMIDDLYGKGAASYLITISGERTKLTPDWLIFHIGEYRSKVKELKKEKNL